MVETIVLLASSISIRGVFRPEIEA
jgi:hypothetical protein